MKQTLLFLLLACFSLVAAAQLSAVGDGGQFPQPTKISIYPNPATNYISINKDENVKQIAIFNLVGRKLKTIEDVEKDEQYDVSDLPNGMYLVQIIDKSNKIITTQRVSKR
jgi:hypothetical protein